MSDELWVKEAIAMHRVLIKDREAGGDEDKRFIALALCGEVGELANLIKKDWRGDDGDRSQDIAGELADVRIYLELLAWCYDVDLDRASRNKMDENLVRWPHTYKEVMAACVQYEHDHGVY